MVSAPEGPVGPTGAALRNSWILFGLIPVVGGVILLVAAIWIAVSIGRGDESKGIHDRVAKTGVVATS